jgi:hypothetical protein
MGDHIGIALAEKLHLAHGETFSKTQHTTFGDQRARRRLAQEVLLALNRGVKPADMRLMARW